MDALASSRDTMIDRFDVRAHLDIIPDPSTSTSSGGKSAAAEEEEANPGINERYRILIQSDCLEVRFTTEQFGTSATTHSHLLTHAAQSAQAAIGYNYDDNQPVAFSQARFTPPHRPFQLPREVVVGAPADADEESEEEIDFDLLVNVDDLTQGQKAELNNYGTKYGMGAGDFMEYLNGDLEEKEKLRLAKLQEEKQAMSGRKARREREAYKDKLIMRKGYISPPSYATYATNPEGGDGEGGDNDDEDDDGKRSSSHSSRSRSNSPEKITFITSFGGNESDDGKGHRALDRKDGTVFG
ncbi:CLK4-associating serine/arginine rich protein, partial [Orchesella cincta]